MRAPVFLVGAIAGAVLVGGCSSDQDGDTPEATGGTASATTTASPSASGTATATDRRLTDAEAKAALVTKTDLPGGWDQVGQGVTRATLTERVLAGRTEPAACQTLLDQANPADTTTLSVAAFRRTIAGPWLAETVASYPEPTASRIADVSAAVQACPKFTLVASNGDRVDVEVEPAAPSLAGDDSVGFRLSGKRGVVPVVADVVLVARGRTMVGAVGGGVTALSDDVVLDTVNASVARLPAE